jgi:uncharacterized protein YabE (DUF348 family)
MLIAACQPPAVIPSVTIIDNGSIIAAETADTVPINILAQAGITLQPDDRILIDGAAQAIDQPVCMACTIQIIHAVNVIVITPDGSNPFRSSAPSVGELLREIGITIRAADRVDPDLDSALAEGLAITYIPSRDLIVNIAGRSIPIRSSASTVGAALAEAGISLQGIDYSIPSENDPLPADGQIKVVRVQESILLQQKSLPFKNEFAASADVELDQQGVLQVGQYGLAMSRVRIRYEDGAEVSRKTEAESIVRPAVNKIVGYGTKVVVRTETIGGQTIEYWRKIQMYATWYSPCHSGTSGCSYGTASGMRAGRGVVAVTPESFNVMSGQQLYIPAYGSAVIGDVGGGYIIEQNLGISRYRWIDLGMDDDNIIDLTGWITVYFLTPVPNNIIYVLD